MAGRKCGVVTAKSLRMDVQIIVWTSRCKPTQKGDCDDDQEDSGGQGIGSLEFEVGRLNL
jgi:hypothetical protein